MKQQLAALKYTHGMGYIHRDVKPDNILIKARGEHFHSKLADLGLAIDRCGHKNAVGTYNNVAPEVLQKPYDYDHRVDVWALGVVYMEVRVNLPLNSGERPTMGWFRSIQRCARNYWKDSNILGMLETRPESRLSAGDCLSEWESLGHPARADESSRDRPASVRQRETPMYKPGLVAPVFDFEETRGEWTQGIFWKAASRRPFPVKVLLKVVGIRVSSLDMYVLAAQVVSVFFGFFPFPPMKRVPSAYSLAPVVQPHVAHARAGTQMTIGCLDRIGRSTCNPCVAERRMRISEYEV